MQCASRALSCCYAVTYGVETAMLAGVAQAERATVCREITVCRGRLLLSAQPVGDSSHGEQS